VAVFLLSFMAEPTTPYTPEAQAVVSSLLLERRSIHKFRPELPPVALLQAAIEHARFAPNHHLTEPWKFYLFGPQSRAQLIALNTSLTAVQKGPEKAAQNQAKWEARPGYFAVTTALSPQAPKQELEDFAATTCAIHNLTLYLWAQGVGLKWGSGELLNAPELYTIIGADPSRERIIGVFSYGYPADIPRTKRSKSVADIMVEMA
jgi:nitroreductase